MRLVASSSAQVLLIQVRKKLAMTQQEFSDRARAHDAAVLGDKTLEELGLVESRPPAAAAPQAAPAGSSR